MQPGLTLKGLRHTVATILREMGKDYATIAEMLGQKTEAMAKHYSRRAERSTIPAGPCALNRSTQRETIFDETPQRRAAWALDTWPLATAKAISSRRNGVSRAFLWMFIRGDPGKLRCGNSSLLNPLRMDNLRKAHS